MLFDPNSFLDATVTGAMSTRVPVIPDGEYIAGVTGVRIRTVPRDDGSQSVILDVTWRISESPALADKALANLPVRQSIFLDLTPEGALDLGPGKNIRLGRLREAVRQNDPARPWSPRMLEGQVARIRITHRVDSETGDIYNEVAQVNAI